MFNAADASIVTPLAGLTGFLVIILVLTVPIFVRYGFRYAVLKRRIAGIKKNNTVVPEYQAPINIPPAFFGTMIDNHASMASIYATFLSLHVKGYVHIRYDANQGDYYLVTQSKPFEGLIRHELYLMRMVPYDSSQVLWAKTFAADSQTYYREFSFCLMQDLQDAGYYFFDKQMASMSVNSYTWTVALKAIGKGLIKPWNWPGFLLSLVLWPFGFAWLIISVIYYNRLGLFNYRTKKWDEIWAALAGYYTYLQVVEAKKRESDPTVINGEVQITEHDPYLAAADMQQKWRSIFISGFEVGGRTADYETYKA